MKHFKKSIVSVMCTLALTGYGSTVFANSQPEIVNPTPAEQLSNIDEKIAYIDAQLRIAEQYIIIYNDRAYFNFDKAWSDGISEEARNLGLQMEELSQIYSHGEFKPSEYLYRDGIPVYGNYCGPWHTGNDFTLPTIDVLDFGCMEHDKCYKWGSFQNCECNRRLLDYIKVNRRWMGQEALEKSRIIQWYFETFGLLGC